MFASSDIKIIEEILGCKLPPEVANEASNPASVLWEETDGNRFTFLTIAEHRQLQIFIANKAMSPLPYLPELKILWTDGESNFMGAFVSGPMLGRLALVGHDTNIDCAPLYRNIGNFIHAMETGRINPDAEWPDKQSGHIK